MLGKGQEGSGAQTCAVKGAIEVCDDCNLGHVYGCAVNLCGMHGVCGQWEGVKLTPATPLD